MDEEEEDEGGGAVPGADERTQTSLWARKTLLLVDAKTLPEQILS